MHDTPATYPVPVGNQKPFGKYLNSRGTEVLLFTTKYVSIKTARVSGINIHDNYFDLLIVIFNLAA
jgi:hypothetical protein